MNVRQAWGMEGSCFNTLPGKVILGSVWVCSEMTIELNEEREEFRCVEIIFLLATIT